MGSLEGVCYLRPDVTGIREGTVVGEVERQIEYPRSKRRWWMRLWKLRCIGI